MADVEYTFPRQESFNFLNGQEALTVSVYKASTANLLDVVDRVKVELGEIQKLPTAEGLRFRHFRDSSVDIRKGLGQLRNAGLVGGGLAILFLFLFLRKIRTTLLVAIAIPISVVLTFVIMYFSRQMNLSNITINIISLMGLMLAVGMLVDNSIVVIEAIYRRYQDLGEDAKTAALRGTSEVAMPIIASTVTTICVFVPLVFLGSGGGFMRFMTDVGTTICIVMVSSLLVALTVVPMVATIVMKGESSQRSNVVDWLVRTIWDRHRLHLQTSVCFFPEHRGHALRILAALRYHRAVVFTPDHGAPSLPVCRYASPFHRGAKSGSP